MDALTRLHRSLAGGDDEERPEDGFLVDTEGLCSLSPLQRVYGFAVCLVAGLALMMLSLLVFIRPIKFAVMFTFGNIMTVGSTVFLTGPNQQLRMMLDPIRVYATAIYVGCVVFALIFALLIHDKLLTLIAIICEICALFWYESDIWTEVAKHLHGTDLVRLALTCRWFRRLIAEDSIWRYAFLRDLSLPADDAELHTHRPLHRSWRLVYAAAFDESHAYCFRQQEKHIDWFRIGGFVMDTSYQLLTGKLALPRWMPAADDGVQISIEMTGACLLPNTRRGIWIADMNLVRCPVCNLNNCEGTMQVLDARHCELYLEEKFRDGTWEYEDLGQHFIDGEVATAAAAIFNAKHLASQYTANVLNAKSWIRGRHNLQPKGHFTPVAVALSTNLQHNQGLLSRFQAMRDMTRDGQIVSVRITQQLL